MRPTRHRLRLGALLGATLMAALASPPTLFLINESRSVPRGIYLRRADLYPAAGRLVTVAPPPQASDYLRSLGRSDNAPLLKRLAAREGDMVCARGDRVRVGADERVRLRRDRRGQPLPWWCGCRRMRAGEVFVLGDAAASFDSRYFGPVEAGAVGPVFERIVAW